MVKQRERRTKLAERNLPDYTKGEEVFNMVSHIVGGGFGVVGLVLSVVLAALRNNVTGVVAAVIFGTSLIMLYTMSAIYHGLSPRLKAKKVMQIFDHLAIFILIAGSYTPITLCAIVPEAAALGWSLFGIVWGVSALGIVLNAIDLKKYARFSMACYLGLGWCVVVSFPVLMARLPLAAIALLLAGGVAYTVGAVLYLLGAKRRYMHSVFHVMVVIGSILHGLMIMLYVV
ncbi:hemolysin III family protein [Candidatus Saccharibacteria bacterium]|nr:hemolysin III family protein [Candidatus Saccharibacteria bacterium]